MRYFPILLIILMSCKIKYKSSDYDSSVYKEVVEARNKFWAAAREGKIDSMLTFHLDSNVYKLYENGKHWDYMFQKESHIDMKQQGIKSIDFNVVVRDSIVFDDQAVLETWDGVTITRNSGAVADTSPRFIVSILYQKVNEKWKFRYIHSSSGH